MNEIKLRDIKELINKEDLENLEIKLWNIINNKIMFNLFINVDLDIDEVTLLYLILKDKKLELENNKNEFTLFRMKNNDYVILDKKDFEENYVFNNTGNE